MTRRKYKQGRVLNPFEALCDITEGRFIYCRHKIYHPGWAGGWHINYLIREARKGNIREALKNENA